MNKIILNEEEFILENFNKNTSYNNGVIISTGFAAIITEDITTVKALAAKPITKIQVYHDDQLIYNLVNTNAHVDSISEFLANDHMSININMTFKEGA